MCAFFRLTVETVNGYNGVRSFHPHTLKILNNQGSIIAFRASLNRRGFTAAAVTAIEQEGFDIMHEISLVTKSGFKTMLKTLQEHTTITTQDGAGRNVVTKAPVVVSDCADKCFYALILWIKIMLDQYRYIVLE